MSTSILSVAYRGLSAGTHMAIVNSISVLGWSHRIVSDDAIIDHARGVLVSAWYRETKDEACVMVDDDIEFVPQNLTRLLESLARPNVDAVSAVYPARVGQTIMGTPLAPDATWPTHDSLIELARTGLGCIAVKRSMIEGLTKTLPECDADSITGSLWPMFLPMIRQQHYIGEDAAFSIRARKAGFRLWLDPRVSVKHLSNELPVALSNMFLVDAAYNNARAMGGNGTT